MKGKNSIWKSLAIILVVCFASVQSFAQTNFGILACVGGATVSNHDGSALRFGAFNIGGFVDLSFAEVLELEGQLSFANRGDAYDVDITGGIPPFQQMINYDGAVHMNYVQIAALLNYVGGETVSIGGGLYAGVLVAAKDKGDATINGIKSEYDEDFKDDAESLDLGAQIEVLFNISEKIALGLNFQKGFTEVWDPGAEDSPTNTFIGLCAKVRLTDN